MKYLDKGVTAKDFDEYWTETGVLVDERVEQIGSLCPEVETSVDLGGGTGGLAQTKKSLVVDWSPVACAKAETLGVKTVCKNILDFVQECDTQFDLVILADVLEEMRMDETERLLDGVKKICKKYFVISTPTHENYLDITTHQVIYSKDELLEKIKARGFTMEDEVYYSDRLIARFAL